MIRSRNCQNALRTQSGIFWTLTACATSATSHVNALSITGQVVGFVITGSSFYTRAIQSIFITGTALDNTISLLVVGQNQFGETVSETISLAAGTNTAQTTFCYRRVTSITITAAGGAFGADDTISVGYSVAAPRLPLLAKLESTGSTLAVKDVNQAGTQPTFTTALAPTYSIAVSAVSLVPATAGSCTVTVHLDPEDAGL